MNWIILLLVSVVAMIASICFEQKTGSDWPVVVFLIGITVSIVCVCVFAIGKLQTPQEINAFTKQKTYIEMHEAKNAVEDAALTSKKIELNEWLYDAQCSKSRFGSWSFYPDSIFDLEPIE